MHLVGRGQRSSLVVVMGRRVAYLPPLQKATPTSIKSSLESYIHCLRSLGGRERTLRI